MYCQNNCFLISAVQVLWHLEIFRRSFRDIKDHTCTSDSCIFCALKELFAQFQCSRESVLPPDALRLALAETFFDQRRFQLDFLHDALECFENILMRIHFHLANHEPEDMCTASHCIPHQKFSMILMEQNVCHECEATSEPLLFTQLIHYVSSSALCSEAILMIKKQRDPTQAFGHLLQRAGSMGDIHNCQSSCVAKIQIYKTLMNHPEIVSIGIVWESENPTLDHIMNVIKTIGLTVNLQDMFHSVIDHKRANSTTHQLVGIVTYYDKHYSTFFFHTNLWSWLYFDDASVSEIGPRWEQVIDKCYRGHFKPLLLLYADPHGSPVSSETAQKLVTVITGHNMCTSGKGLKEDKETICTVPIHLNQFNGNQRRAFTPNPETSGENLSNIPQRRAITPSRELSYTNEFDSEVIQCSFNNSMIDTNYLVSSSKHPYISTANPSCMFSSFQNHLKHPLTSVWPQHQHDGHYGNRIFHLEGSSPCELTEETFKCRSNILFFQNKMFSGGIPEMKPEIRRISCPTSHTMSQHSSYAESKNGKTYIRREAVESILKAQKLQWQKTMNESFRSLSKSGITSSSSIFCDRTLKPQDLIATNDITLKIDIPDLSTFERCDSGNWSGDCHSASSISTSSIDNGSPGMIINNRLNTNMLAYGNLEQVYVDSKGPVTAWDHGYDSCSISSTESCPSATTNSSEKPETQMIQIDEDKQMHFPKSDNVEASEKCFLKQQQAKIFRGDCNKFCVQADALQIKSQEKEGQLQVAILPSDVAAAKARKANDATFSNLKSSMASKMKHRRCVIRSSSLHRNPKELRNDDCKYKDAVFKTNYSKNSDRVANQKHSGAVNPQKNNNEFLRAHHFGTGVNENVDKTLQVSKSHPMKSSKCNDNCEVFEETVNQQLSENLLEDLANCHISSFSFHPKSQSDNRLTTENFSKRTNLIFDKEQSYQGKTDQSKLHKQQISIKNEILTSTKKSNQSFLQRTNSVPITSLNDDFEKSSDIANQKFASQSRKKQHKIQQKCFSGFIQRKNYSLPDLREKITQDDVQTNPLDSGIFDTLQFINSQQFKTSTPDDFSTRIQEPTDSKSSHQNSHENKISTSNKILQRQETSMEECNYYPEESKSLFTHHLASVCNSSQNVNNYFTKDKSSTSKCSYHLNRSSYLGSGYLPNTNESQKNDRQCSQLYNYSTKKIPSKLPSSQQELITSFNYKIKGPLSRYQEMKTTIPQDLFRNHSSDEVEWFKELQQKQVQLLQKRRLWPYRNLRLEDSQSVENRPSCKTLSEAQKTPEGKNFHQLLQWSKMEFNRNIKRNQAYTSYVKCFQGENDPASRTETVIKPSDITESILRDESKSFAEHFQVTGDIILSVPSDIPLTIAKQTESQHIKHPIMCEKQLFDGPPDYETTLRRLELFRNKWSSTDATIFSICTGRQTTSKVSKIKNVLPEHTQFVSNYHRKNLKLSDQTKQKHRIQSLGNRVSKGNPHPGKSSRKCKISYFSTCDGISHSLILPRKKQVTKKCVTFSDQVVLVSCIEDKRNDAVVSNTQVMKMQGKSSVQKKLFGCGLSNKETMSPKKKTAWKTFRI